MAVSYESIVLRNNRVPNVEELLAAEFDRVLKKYPEDKYHTHKVDCRFPRGAQLVYYALRSEMGQEAFNSEVKKHWEEYYRELCSY